jgi:hypothetical protein
MVQTCTTVIQRCCSSEGRVLSIRNKNEPTICNMTDANLQLKIRLPPEIKEWVSARAARNYRSLNSEIAHTLKMAMEREFVEENKK